MFNFPDRLHPDLPEADRRKVLNDSCDEVLDGVRFTRPLTELEIQNRKDTLADRAIKIADLEAEKKRIAAEYEAKLKPIKIEQSLVLGEIKTRSVDAIEPLYVFRDLEGGYSYRYDQRGQMVDRRVLSPQEMQATTMQVLRGDDNRRAIGE